MKSIDERPPDWTAMPVARITSGTGKWQAVRLVRDLHRELHLSERACRALEIIARPTREEDWFNPGNGPVCYRPKNAMAEELGVSGRQFYNIECQLEHAGLLERRLTRNGWRGTCGSATGASVSGLSLAPLVRRASELAACAAAQKAERDTRAALRLDIRVAWGELARRLSDDADHLALAPMELAPPRSEIFAKWSLDQLRFRLRELQQALAGSVDENRNAGEISDASEAEFRSHTEDTTNESVSCSEAQPDQPTNTQAKGKTGSDSSRRNEGDLPRRTRQIRGKGAAVSSTMAVSVGLLRRIATPELRFYLEGLSCRGIEDAERAIAFRLRELGIGARAYEDARQEMSLSSALLAVAIIDRNRTHPRTPIRSPGAVLRAMTRRHRNGDLDLTASVFGILARAVGAPQDGISPSGPPCPSRHLFGSATADPSPLPRPDHLMIDVEKPLQVIEPVAHADDTLVQNENSDRTRQAPRMNSCHLAGPFEDHASGVTQPWRAGQRKAAFACPCGLPPGTPCHEIGGGASSK